MYLKVWAQRVNDLNLLTKSFESINEVLSAIRPHKIDNWCRIHCSMEGVESGYYSDVGDLGV